MLELEFLELAVLELEVLELEVLESQRKIVYRVKRHFRTVDRPSVGTEYKVTE